MPQRPETAPVFVPTPAQEAELQAAHLARFGRPAAAECFRVVPLCDGMEQWLDLLADIDRMAHMLVDLYRADPASPMVSPSGGDSPVKRP